METMPITNYILQQFERSMTVSVDASDLDWAAGFWPKAFYVMGHERVFSHHSDIRRHGVLKAVVYRDSAGYEIRVDND